MNPEEGGRKPTRFVARIALLHGWVVIAAIHTAAAAQWSIADRSTVHIVTSLSIDDHYRRVIACVCVRAQRHDSGLVIVAGTVAACFCRV